MLLQMPRGGCWLIHFASVPTGLLVMQCHNLTRQAVCWCRVKLLSWPVGIGSWCVVKLKFRSVVQVCTMHPEVEGHRHPSLSRLRVGLLGHPSLLRLEVGDTPACRGCVKWNRFNSVCRQIISYFTLSMLGVFSTVGYLVNHSQSYFQLVGIDA